MTIEDFIITTLLTLDEIMKNCTQGIRIRTAGFKPALTDLEVLTMEVVGEFIGLKQDKKIWLFFKQHYKPWFPELRSRSNFVKQAANLLPIKNLILQELFKKPQHSQLHIVDGVPMPIIHLARASREKQFKGEAYYGYCASKKEHYYGFLGHVLIDGEGMLSGFTLTPANGSEREALISMSEQLHGGMVLGDRGFIGVFVKQSLKDRGLDLQTNLRANMVETRPKKFLKWLTATRRLVETVIGQLTERFAINAIRVKDFLHLQSRIARKLLSHSISTLIAKNLGLVPTQLDSLVQV
jgi:hypothetical protein